MDCLKLEILEKNDSLKVTFRAKTTAFLGDLDYYPFGMQMPGRNFNSSEYRFGAQGSEKDDEITGVTGSHFTTFFREFDTRIGRPWTPDPVFQAWQSPYTSMDNNPILYNDPLGDKIKGATEDDAKETKSQISQSLNVSPTDKIMSFFNTGDDNKTFNKIGRREFNKYINSEEAGFSDEQKALANSYMKSINDVKVVSVAFGQSIDAFKATGETTGEVTLRSQETKFMDTEGNLRTSTLTQRFVHEVAGEAYTAMQTGNLKTYENIIDNYKSKRLNPNSSPDFYKSNLQVIQAENLYNRMNGFLRSGLTGQPGDHGLLQKDMPKVGNIPSSYRSSW